MPPSRGRPAPPEPDPVQPRRPASRGAEAEARRAALTVSGLFAGAGALWLLLPDALLARGPNRSAELQHLLRDALFLLVAGVLLYVVIRRLLVHGLAAHGLAAPAPPAESGPRLQVLGRLAAGMAHDVNNVLATIIGYADLVLRRLPLEDTNHADVLAIRRAAERGAGLARDVLAPGRAPTSSPQVLDLNAVLVDLGRMLPRLVGPGIQVLVEPAPRPARVLADLTQLEQVLLNLVLNARDAMPRGGRLALRATLAPAAADAAPQVELEVSDTGEGMDEATRARIFEPFFTTKATGTGLGLASVSQAVDALGGSVRCDSVPGRGTTFRVRLPRVEGAPAPLPAPEAPACDPPAVCAVVLVVDDDAALCDVLARMLVAGGHEARVAHDGRQALAAATGDVDVVLCDMLMPEREGLETIAELRQRRPSLPILAMSGALRGESYTAMALKLGAVGALRKPFGPRELLAAVGEALIAPVPAAGGAPPQETERV